MCQNCVKVLKILEKEKKPTKKVKQGKSGYIDDKIKERVGSIEIKVDKIIKYDEINEKFKWRVRGSPRSRLHLKKVFVNNSL